MYFLCWKLKTINQIEKKPFNYIEKPPKQPWKSHPISIFKIDNTNKLVIFCQFAKKCVRNWGRKLQALKYIARTSQVIFEKASTRTSQLASCGRTFASHALVLTLGRKQQYSSKYMSKPEHKIKQPVHVSLHQ